MFTRVFNGVTNWRLVQKSVNPQDFLYFILVCMGRLNAGDKLYSNILENLLIEETASMDLAPVITVSRMYCELLHDQYQVWYALTNSLDFVEQYLLRFCPWDFIFMAYPWKSQNLFLGHYFSDLQKREMFIQDVPKF